MLAAVHLHILHHTLDPLGIVLAAVALTIAVVSLAAVAAWVIRRRTA